MADIKISQSDVSWVQWDGATQGLISGIVSVSSYITIVVDDNLKISVGDDQTAKEAEKSSILKALQKKYSSPGAQATKTVIVNKLAKIKTALESQSTKYDMAKVKEELKKKELNVSAIFLLNLGQDNDAIIAAVLTACSLDPKNFEKQATPTLPVDNSQSDEGNPSLSVPQPPSPTGPTFADNNVQKAYDLFRLAGLDIQPATLDTDSNNSITFEELNTALNAKAVELSVAGANASVINMSDGIQSGNEADLVRAVLEKLINTQRIADSPELRIADNGWNLLFAGGSSQAVQSDGTVTADNIATLEDIVAYVDLIESSAGPDKTLRAYLTHNIFVLRKKVKETSDKICETYGYSDKTKIPVADLLKHINPDLRPLVIVLLHENGMLGSSANVEDATLTMTEEQLQKILFSIELLRLIDNPADFYKEAKDTKRADKDESVSASLEYLTLGGDKPIKAEEEKKAEGTDESRNLTGIAKLNHDFQKFFQDNFNGEAVPTPAGEDASQRGQMVSYEHASLKDPSKRDEVLKKLEEYLNKYVDLIGDTASSDIDKKAASTKLGFVLTLARAIDNKEKEIETKFIEILNNKWKTATDKKQYEQLALFLVTYLALEKYGATKKTYRSGDSVASNNINSFVVQIIEISSSLLSVYLEMRSTDSIAASEKITKLQDLVGGIFVDGLDVLTLETLKRESALLGKIIPELPDVDREKAIFRVYIPVHRLIRMEDGISPNLEKCLKVALLLDLTDSQLASYFAITGKKVISQHLPPKKEEDTDASSDKKKPKKVNSSQMRLAVDLIAKARKTLKALTAAAAKREKVKLQPTSGSGTSRGSHSGSSKVGAAGVTPPVVAGFNAATVAGSVWSSISDKVGKWGSTTDQSQKANLRIQIINGINDAIKNYTPDQQNAIKTEIRKKLPKGFSLQ